MDPECFFEHDAQASFFSLWREQCEGHNPIVIRVGLISQQGRHCLFQEHT